MKSKTGPKEHGTAFSIFLPLDGKPANPKPASLAELGRVS